MYSFNDKYNSKPVGSSPKEIVLITFSFSRKYSNCFSISKEVFIVFFNISNGKTI